MKKQHSLRIGTFHEAGKLSSFDTHQHLIKSFIEKENHLISAGIGRVENTFQLNLSSDDIALLHTYFDTGCSLSSVCERLYMHKNTLVTPNASVCNNV